MRILLWMNKAVNFFNLWIIFHKVNFARKICKIFEILNKNSTSIFITPKNQFLTNFISNKWICILKMSFVNLQRSSLDAFLLRIWKSIKIAKKLLMYDYRLLSLNKSLALTLFFYESKYKKKKSRRLTKNSFYVPRSIVVRNSKLSEIKIYSKSTYSVETHKLSYLHLTLTSDLFYY